MVDFAPQLGGTLARMDEPLCDHRAWISIRARARPPGAVSASASARSLSLPSFPMTPVQEAARAWHQRVMDWRVGCC